MVFHAKSKRQQEKADSDLLEKWIQRAMKIYTDARAFGVEYPPSLKTSIERAQLECLQQDKKKIQLSTSTLQRRLQGGQTRRQGHEHENWLTAAEADIVVNFAIECADRGFPLSHRRLKEHVDQLARARLGDAFPETGVGKQWTQRFVSDHSDRLGTYWTRALDRSRARAVNPTTKAEYFDLLEQIIEGEGGDDRIPAELIWGADESGFQLGIGQRERVIGGRGRKTQYQQRSGNRENVTSLVTICGDGTATIPPAVIFKGEGFQANWVQDNPLNASLGYQKKGYIDGEISVEWLRDFDKRTRRKACGRRRLLLVDGHSSHYTLSFLQAAREADIEVLGYPSHSTHVYQGLDVVIFAPFKTNWSAARDRAEARGVVVDKTTFLSVYAEAHLKTLTPENIRMAFKKTGVIPLNRDVVTEQMMAPSLESSLRATLPIPQSSPVKLMSSMIVDYLDYQKLQAMPMVIDDDNEPSTAGPSRSSPSYATPLFVRATVDALSGTSASYLTRSSPLKSTSSIPSFKPSTISPLKRQSRYTDLLDGPILTEREQRFAEALRESEARDEKRKSSLIEVQAGAVLGGMWNARAQVQLQTQEVRKGRRKGKGRMGDGKAKWFMSDAFYELAKKDAVERAEEAVGKEQRKVTREARAVEVAEWKRDNDQIRERNEAKKATFGIDTTAWEAREGRGKGGEAEAGMGEAQVEGVSS